MYMHPHTPTSNYVYEHSCFRLCNDYNRVGEGFMNELIISRSIPFSSTYLSLFEAGMSWCLMNDQKYSFRMKSGGMILSYSILNECNYLVE